MRKYFIVEYWYDKNKISQAEISSYIQEALLSHCGGYKADDKRVDLKTGLQSVRSANSVETAILSVKNSYLVK